MGVNEVHINIRVTVSVMVSATVRVSLVSLVSTGSSDSRISLEIRLSDV